ncbi:MAG: 23S rRNA (adenine(2503)-C(2))-methyltransferase RlmN [Chloroflexus aggregans]|uniref:Probable dual-specificity RNA methyltransferase RlmN n=1 Tax=Chloroflexus aggregans TaxID=152260 RepID=A0A2J6WV19_9CHLR|nr:MAG: 23S rRNA (adenine(2503)-C(2))-methyltransferase RlmN [Chloroflexus aggregans]
MEHAMEQRCLYDYNLAELTELLKGWGEPSFRARQLYRHLYVNLTASIERMTDLPATLRVRLAELPLSTLRLERVQTGDAGLTRKALFRLPDGAVVETVLMVYPNRSTVCVSTQAGCGMGCVFCATGRLGLLRNLSSGEIVAQAIWASQELRTMNAAGPTGRVTNLVFMGMGEPFANYDRWWQAVERLHDPQGFNLGARSMTVSTVGLVKGIERLANERLPVNLAISLHAPDDTLRSELMPVNRRYPIAELMAATRQYITKTRRRVSFEYVLLQGKNDHPHQAIALARLLRRETPPGPMLVHVNLIPWNPVPGTPLGRSEWERVTAFQQILTDYGIPCTVRVERGIEIAAACGQLAGQTTLMVEIT